MLNIGLIYLFLGVISHASFGALVGSATPSPSPETTATPPSPTASPTNSPQSSVLPTASPTPSPSPYSSPSPSPSATPDNQRGPRINGGQDVCWQKGKRAEEQNVKDFAMKVTASKTEPTSVFWYVVGSYQEGNLQKNVNSADAAGLVALKYDLNLVCNGVNLSTNSRMNLAAGQESEINCSFTGNPNLYSAIRVYFRTTPNALNAGSPETYFSANVKDVCCAKKVESCGPDEVLGTQCGCPTCLCKSGLPKVNGRCPCEGNWGSQDVEAISFFVVGKERSGNGIQSPAARFSKGDYSVRPKLHFCIGALMPASASEAELNALEQIVRREKANWDAAWTKIYKAPSGGRDIAFSSEIKISRAEKLRLTPRLGDCKIEPGFSYIRVTNEKFTEIDLETNIPKPSCRPYSDHWKFCKGMEAYFSAHSAHEVGHAGLGMPDQYAEGNREAYQECGRPVTNSIMGNYLNCWPNCELSGATKAIPFYLACSGPCPDSTTSGSIGCEKCGDVSQRACRAPASTERNALYPNKKLIPDEKCECFPYSHGY